jgi:hypothetical protein
MLSSPGQVVIGYNGSRVDEIAIVEMMIVVEACVLCVLSVEIAVSDNRK